MPHISLSFFREHVGYPNSSFRLRPVSFRGRGLELRALFSRLREFGTFQSETLQPLVYIGFLEGKNGRVDP